MVYSTGMSVYTTYLYILHPHISILISAIFISPRRLYHPLLQNIH